MSNTAQARKREAARQKLEASGTTLTAFARTHKLKRHVVVDVLRGRTSGRYGEAHKAAVALGLKTPPGDQ